MENLLEEPQDQITEQVVLTARVYFDTDSYEVAHYDLKQMLKNAGYFEVIESTKEKI